MEIVKVGTNTKNAEGIKISREIRKTFETYLKAKQALKETVEINGEKITYDKITVEQLYVSYLATFKESEDYKATEKAKKEKDAKNTEQAEANKKEKKAAIRKMLEERGIEGETLEALVNELTSPKKKGRKKATETAIEQE